MQSNSWFSTRSNWAQNKSLYKICCPSEVASVLGCVVNENTEKKKSRSYGKNPFKRSQNITPNSVLKIPLFPEPGLHAIWKKWLAAYRWVYNQCVELYNSACTSTNLSARKSKLLGKSISGCGTS